MKRGLSFWKECYRRGGQEPFPYRMSRKRGWVLGLVLACVGGVIGSVWGGELIPWVMPWDDAAPGPVDRSAWNRPIGPEDRITVDRQGHFSVRGRRIRILGINFAGDAPFMPTNKADAVAARLAKFGINCVRFHHIDAPWATGGGVLRYTSVRSRDFRPTQLKRIQYLVAALKRHGIYSDINLLTGRQYRSQDGLGPEVVQLPWKVQHVLAYFYEPALELQKEFARKLLGSVNPFTGLPLAKDPAVAFVEIINENGLIQQWLAGALDALPQRYAQALQLRWNQWLQKRYDSEATLEEAWHVIREPLGPNLLHNGAFTAGFRYWRQEQHDGAYARFTVQEDPILGRPACRIEVTQPGSENWHVQLNYPDLRVQANQVYTLVFRARAEQQGVPLDVSIMQDHSPWGSLGFSRHIELGTEWNVYSNVFLLSRSDTDAQVNFGGFGTRKVAVWLADVALYRGGTLGALPEGASLREGTVPILSRSREGFFGTREAQVDWIRFLTDLEREYYEEMVRLLREDLDYQGLIWGTITANAPLSVLSMMDVIDTHAYWQHPVFPEQPWDPENWYVRNLSMLNTLGEDNMIPRIARVRVFGKPFTLSEYQHPSPNEYGAEGPLLIAAYGALQDWDGIWFFDYGPGQDSVPMGQIRGFFDMAQHPTKMANLFVAANLFRRGDVRPARQRFVAPYSVQTEAEWIARYSSSWRVTDPSRTGIPTRLPFQSQVGLKLVDTTAAIPQFPEPSSKRVESDTKELVWDLQTPGRGYLVVNTPRTKGVVGFVRNRTFQIGGMELRFGTNRLDWASAFLTASGTNPLWQGGSAVFVVCGLCQNTGWVWKDASHTSLGRNWGTAPTLVEIVPVDVILPVPPEAVRAWTLNERGQRDHPVPIREQNGRAWIRLGVDGCSLWYELEIRPPQSYSDWQRRFFRPAELDNPQISGPDACVSEDGLPNAVHYALGWEPYSPIPPDRLPRPCWVQTDGQLHFGVSLFFPAGLPPMDWQVRFSQDLSLWEPTGSNWLSTPLSQSDAGHWSAICDPRPFSVIPHLFLQTRLRWE